MGCLFGARLKNAGFQVALLEKAGDVADRINKNGIFVEGVSGRYRAMVPVYLGEAPQQPDLVLFFVKSYDTLEASKTVRSWRQPEALVLTLQNGVGNMEILRHAFGAERVLGGVSAEGSTVLAPGKIKHAGRGETIIGGGAKAEEIASLFKKAGFETRAVENIDGYIWGKLVVNVGINALAAITRLKNGRLPELKSTRSVMKEAVSEAIAVIRAKRISLPYPDPMARVMEVCRATAENTASMLQDVLSRKRTEIDVINGAIVKEGAALGIPMPVNSTLVSLVSAIQETFDGR
jgi:2-dehydropantoate 2-reductase